MEENNYRFKINKGLGMFWVNFFVIFICIFSFPLYLLRAENILDNENTANITRQEAFIKYGPPNKIDDYKWCYDYPDNFCISFSNDSADTKIIIFPYVSVARVGVPFEIKAFIVKANSRIEEITSYVKWIINDKDMVLKKEGFFSPIKKGKTEILAVYKDIISNPLNIFIKNPAKIIQEDINEAETNEAETNEDKLLMIDVFPYNPVIGKHSYIKFSALGVFLNPQTKNIFSKEISSKVRWFYLFKGNTKQKLRNTIYFRDSGTSKVYCEYRGVKSILQEVKVEDAFSPIEGLIRSIRLVPAVLLANEGYTVQLKALATHYTNKVDNVTSRIIWKNINDTVGKVDSNGKLKLYEEGLIQVVGRIRNIKTSTSKIIVKKELSDDEYLVDGVVKDEEMDELIDEMSEDEDLKKNIEQDDGVFKIESIKDAVEKLFFSVNKKFILKAEPYLVNLSLGEESKVNVKLYYSDSIEYDVTSSVKWEISYPEKVKIENENIIALKEGTGTIIANLEGVDSNTIRVDIDKAKLKTIVLRGKQNLIRVGKTIAIEAEGIYTDGKKKNISDLAQWYVDNKTVIEHIGKGSFKAKGKGEVKIYCRYQGVKSLPLVLIVYKSPVQIFLSVFLVICSLFIVLQIFLTIKINNLNKLKVKDPALFIKTIYCNFKKVIKVFGLTCENHITPLKYSRMIEEKFSIDENIFWKISCKFSEFEYSSHVVRYEDALDFGLNYNKAMFLLAKKVPNFFVKYLILLFFQYPFVI